MEAKSASSPKPLSASAAARRALYLDIIRRRVRPGAGSSLSFLRSREAYPMPNLNDLLRGVKYVVVGGTATSLYMPLRTTKDVDILVTSTQTGKAEQALRRAGAVIEGALPLSFRSELGISGTSWTLADASKLDVLVSAQPWVREALARPVRDSSGLPIVALPYLVLLKLDASRTVDIGDLGRMLGGSDDDTLDRARAVVRQYLPDASGDLESLIMLGRLEFQPPSD